MTERSQTRHARARHEAPLVSVLAGVLVGLVVGVILFGALLEVVR